MSDIFEKATSWTDAREMMNTGYYPYFIPGSSEIGPRTKVNGQSVIMLGSNNYLGMTGNQQVKNAAINAIEKYGTGCTGSRFLNGTLDLHLELEKNLAEFTEKEDAIVFSTGFQTNLGVISSMTGLGDVIITDEFNHASIADGIKLSSSKSVKYKHDDMDDLRRVLKEVPDNRGKLIITDGVFSKEGNIANLPEITELATEFDARLMVDDAHGMGYLGKHGEGVGGHHRVMDQIDLLMGTFSKSFASIGGFVSANEEITHYMKHHARSLIFSASLPPASVATVQKSVELIKNGPDLRRAVMRNAIRLKNGLNDLGYDTGHTKTPIVPVIIGDTMKTFIFWKELLEAGVYTNPVRAPAVRPGREMLRTSLMATHTNEDVDEALTIFEQIGKKMELI